MFSCLIDPSLRGTELMGLRAVDSTSSSVSGVYITLLMLFFILIITTTVTDIFAVD